MKVPNLSPKNFRFSPQKVPDLSPESSVFLPEFQPVKAINYYLSDDMTKVKNAYYIITIDLKQYKSRNKSGMKQTPVLFFLRRKVPKETPQKGEKRRV